ncbi:DJ-1/PfpI family protein [Parasphingopyxis marina]|uniref:DJ-1/PfpI family protein n=1 Tax=Parasphingopyxis marina TaxID=2761622 RepID=A0A842HX04_9SPHN|nr:DJ-1/PfpI family protein [Parasphingopyxis marina]MBC2776044.1 DJ-1/PfpI family protein [Parasphingopyxis marina]
MKIGFLLFPHSAEPDVAGPSRLLAALPGVTVSLAAAEQAPVVMDCGCSIRPTASFADAPAFDAICVPGGSGVAAALQSPEFLDYLCEAAERAHWIGAIGTGAFVLGGAGLLVGRYATTHPAYADLLSGVGAEYRAGPIVRDGNVLTCDGAEAALDFAAGLAEAARGQDAAAGLRHLAARDPGYAAAACDRTAPCTGHLPEAGTGYAAHIEAVQSAISANVIGSEYTL